MIGAVVSFAETGIMTDGAITMVGAVVNSMENAGFAIAMATSSTATEGSAAGTVDSAGIVEALLAAAVGTGNSATKL